MKIIQITDCHLLADSKETFCDVYPDQHLKQVIDATNKQKPDLVILTGDCSEDGSVQSYQRIADYFTQITCPVYAIPGNHDNLPAFQEYILSNNIQYTKKLILHDWQIVFLDSVVAGETSGYLNASQFVLLEQALANGKKTIIVMHHHPLPISSFMDRYIVNNHQEFTEFISEQKNIKAVLFGHIHGKFQKKINHINFYGSPATSVQFPQHHDKSNKLCSIAQFGFSIHTLANNALKSEAVILKST